MTRSPSALLPRPQAPGTSPRQRQPNSQSLGLAVLFAAAGLAALPMPSAFAQTHVPPPPAATADDTDGADLDDADVTDVPNVPSPEPAAEDPGTPQDAFTSQDSSLPMQDEGPEPEAPTELEARLGLQSLWVQDKVLVGPTLRFGQGMFFGELETHLMWTTDRPDRIDRPFLGSQYGLHFELMPLRTRHIELSAGVGADIFHLWGIHGDEFQVSLSTRVQAHVRITRSLGATLGARAYPISTSGVALGETRAGDRGMPVLLSTGLEWTW